jgi:hypothetical protein
MTHTEARGRFAVMVLGATLALASACGGPSRCTSTADCAMGLACANGACTNLPDASVDAGTHDAGVDAGHDDGPLPAFDLDGGLPLPAGDTCVVPRALPSRQVVLSTTEGLLNDYDLVPTDGGCVGTSARSAAPDAVFSFTVPAGQHLIIEVLATFNGTLNVVPAPKSSCGTLADDGLTHDARCVAGASFLAADMTPRVLVWRNTAATDADVLLVIDGMQDSDHGDFALRAHAMGPVAGDTCDSALPLPLGTTLTGQSLSAVDGLTGDYQGSGDESCPYWASGVDRVYAVVLPPGTVQTVTATPTGPWKLSLAVAASPTACRQRTCVASSQLPYLGGPQEVTLSNPGLTAQTRYIIVDTDAVASGPFDIQFGPGLSGETCAAPTPLTAGTPLVGQSLAGYSPDLLLNAGGDATCTTGSDAPDRVYSFPLAQGQQATLTFTPATSTDWFSVDLVEGADATCGDGTSCAAALRQGIVLRWTNRGSQDTVVKAVVNSKSQTGLFDLSLSYGAPLAGDFCETALPLGPGSVQATLDGFEPNVARDTATCTGPFAAGVDRVYAVTVPGGQRLVATATPTSTWAPVLNVSESLIDCEGSVCGAQAGAFVNGTPATVLWSNPTAQARTVYLVVGAFMGQGPLDFGLDVSVEDPPPGDACASAVPITGGLLVSSGLKMKGYVDDYGAALTYLGVCDGYEGPDATWSVEVAPGQTLTATATPDATSAVVLDLVRSCDASRPCLAGAPWSSGGAPVTLTWTNQGTSPMSAYLLVGSAFGDMTYDLEVRVQ